LRFIQRLTSLDVIPTPTVFHGSAYFSIWYPPSIFGARRTKRLRYQEKNLFVVFTTIVFYDGWARDSESVMAAILLDNFDEVRSSIKAAKRVYVFLDYDGTLTPIVSKPESATLSKRVSTILRSLSGPPSCRLAIVSGRSIVDLRRLVGIRTIHYLGNHGLEISGPDLNYEDSIAQRSRQNLKGISRKLLYLKTVGVSIENKRLTLAVHYRQVSPRLVPMIKAALRRILHSYPQFKITSGKKVMEVRPNTEWNKGLAAQWLINKLGPGLSVYVGDDKTDEDAFSRLRGGITILVSPIWKSSSTRFRLNDYRDVARFLRCVAL